MVEKKLCRDDVVYAQGRIDKDNEWKQKITDFGKWCERNWASMTLSSFKEKFKEVLESKP